MNFRMEQSPDSTGPSKATHTDSGKQPSDVAITTGD